MEKRFCGGRAFTLIELLVVIAIIAILAAPPQ
jgi:prepilin-type N-terminal cleavage/methylation domain-containing protein